MKNLEIFQNIIQNIVISKYREKPTFSSVEKNYEKRLEYEFALNKGKKTEETVQNSLFVIVIFDNIENLKLMIFHEISGSFCSP